MPSYVAFVAVAALPLISVAQLASPSSELFLTNTYPVVPPVGKAGEVLVVVILKLSEPSNEPDPVISPVKEIVLAVANLVAVPALPAISVAQLASPSMELFLVSTYPTVPPTGKEGKSSSRKNNCPSNPLSGNDAP